MPDRCLRQLGYIQKVPMPILQPMSVVRSSRVVLYSVKFSNSDVVWERFRASRLHISDYTPCTYASEEELGYAMWYNTRSHRKLLPNKISKDWCCDEFYRHLKFLVQLPDEQTTQSFHWRELKRLTQQFSNIFNPSHS